MNTQIWWRIGAVTMFLGVALGAFGAHGLKQIAPEDMQRVFETGARYHQLNAVGMMLAAAHPGQPRWSGPLFAVAITLFSGSLYLMAITEIRMLGAITPIGGLFALAAWITLAVAALPARGTVTT